MCVGVEVREQIIDLDGTHSYEWQHLQVQPATEGSSETVLRGTKGQRAGACADGFMGGADEKVCERRDAPRKAKLRAGEIRLKVHVSALERAGSSAEVRGESKRTEDFDCAANFPTVEIEVLRVASGGAARHWAKNVLGEGDRSAHIRVAAE